MNDERRKRLERREAELIDRFNSPDDPTDAEAIIHELAIVQCALMAMSPVGEPDTYLTA